MIYLLAFLIAVGILVTIHELGHFLMAKLLRVKVKDFSIGFGPAIFKKKIGETTYKLSLIPLGGYVRFENEKEFFQKEKLYKKILIVLGGPLANILLTYILFVFIFYFNFSIPKDFFNKPIFFTLNISSPLNVYNNEVIKKINEKPVKNFKELEKIALKEKPPYILTLENNRTLKVNTLKNIFPYRPPIGKVVNNSLLSKAKVYGNVKFLKIDNYSISSWYDISYYKKLILEKEGKKEIKVKVLLLNKNKTKDVLLYFNSSKVPFGVTYLYADENVKKKISFLEANKLAFKALITYTKKVFEFIASIFKAPNTLEKSVGGPISIAKYSGDALKNGLNSFIVFLALLSLQLGLLNLLPIPVLDGGHLFTFIIEGIIRRPLPENIRYELQIWGFIILLFLTFLALKADFQRFIFKK